ncbi:hypothetical protein [Paenibacillus tritici]|uniref:hypothetical protein n=1 Tax=Paenibacillus tritici TaxID=1873425 RepID=UPI0031BA8F66
MNKYPPSAQKIAKAIEKNKLHSTRFLVKNFFFFFGFPLELGGWLPLFLFPPFLVSWSLDILPPDSLNGKNKNDVHE